MSRISLFVLLLLLLTGFLSLHSQELGQLTFEEVDPMGAIPDDPTVSLLIVESSVPHLGFSSRKGIRTVMEKSASLYYVVLDPGVDYITITANGYLPLELGRMNFPMKSAKKIKVTSKTMAEGEGTLRITSTPSGANIELNGIQLVQKTPARLQNQKTGKYRITLSGIPGYAILDTSAIVKKNNTTLVEVHLSKLIAGLQVTSDPSGARVIWNGDELGTTPLIRNDLKPGEGILTFLMDRYSPVNLGVRLIAGETFRQEVTLVRERGTLEVTTQPSAEVFLDGVSKGVAQTGNLTLKEIETGDYTVSARLEGYDDASDKVSVEADRTTAVTIKPVPRPGSLYVTASRTGATVMIDDAATNVKTPGRVEGVAAGAHQVTVQLLGYAAEAQVVTVAPGAVATANFVLTESSSVTAGNLKLPEGFFTANYIEPTLAEIARLEKVIADKQKGLPKRIEQEVQVLHKTDRDFAAQDPFETEVEFRTRQKHAGQKEADLRKRVESEIAVDEKRQLESLKQRRFIARDFILTLNVENYDANRGKWDFTLKHGEEQTSGVLSIDGDQARNLYQNRNMLKVYGTIAIVNGLLILNSIVIDESADGFQITIIPNQYHWWIPGPLPGMEFVKIPGGTFQMGSPTSEIGRDIDEGPQHSVTLPPFAMMTTEVTQAQWEAMMGANPSGHKGADLPVENISWNEIEDFLGKLNQRDPGKEYRLPTEAEWEYAARAGTTTRFYWGDDPIFKQIVYYAWFDGNSGKQTQIARQKLPNAWGLYDMSGNVWEWCLDWYGPDSNRKVPKVDKSFSGTYHVLRGGSWYFSAGDCRSASRLWRNLSSRTIDFGFRVVRSSPSL
ncbi:MAG: SUMF1/EgtB/PvdO family nonheme iron enzyme [bacterium]